MADRHGTHTGKYLDKGVDLFGIRRAEIQYNDCSVIKSPKTIYQLNNLSLHRSRKWNSKADLLCNTVWWNANQIWLFFLRKLLLLLPLWNKFPSCSSHSSRSHFLPLGKYVFALSFSEILFYRSEFGCYTRQGCHLCIHFQNQRVLHCFPLVIEATHWGHRCASLYCMGRKYCW